MFWLQILAIFRESHYTVEVHDIKHTVTDSKWQGVQ